jgi:CDK-activating kinase assembly factor MAT1
LEVLLGEREEISAEAKQAQMQGYRSELRRQQQGKKAVSNFVSPKVRKPVNGLRKDQVDRPLYLKRQQAGGGLPVNNIASNERAWNETCSSLFAFI